MNHNQWIFHVSDDHVRQRMKALLLTQLQQDGNIQLEIKLTGILNTYSIAQGEDTDGWGTEVAPGKENNTREHVELDS